MLIFCAGNTYLVDAICGRKKIKPAKRQIFPNSVMYILSIFSVYKMLSSLKMSVVKKTMQLLI